MAPFPNYRVGSHKNTNCMAHLAFLSKQYSKPQTNLLKEKIKFGLHQCLDHLQLKLKVF